MKKCIRIGITVLKFVIWGDELSGLWLLVHPPIHLFNWQFWKQLLSSFDLNYFQKFSNYCTQWIFYFTKVYRLSLFRNSASQMYLHSFCLQGLINLKPLNPHLPGGSVILMNRTIPFPILGVSGVHFHFYSILNRYSCKQTMKTLIGCRIPRRLIWVCTVCLCPKNGMLGLYGLTCKSLNDICNLYF